MKHSQFEVIEIIEETGSLGCRVDFVNKVNKALNEDWQVRASGVIETNVGLLRWAHLVRY